MPGRLMAAEIREQPAVFRRLLDQGLPTIRRTAATILDRAPKFVLLVARGTSDHAALYAKYLFEIRLGLPTGLISPSTWTVYGASQRLQDALVIAISQSGRSPDVVTPVERAGASGATTLAITNDDGSPLASAAQHHLPILAGAERAVAATKTYTAELLTLLLLADAMGDRTDEDHGSLPARAEQLLQLETDVAGLAVRYRFAEQILVTSRGYNYATARELALKLGEAARLPSLAFSGADLLHGPVAMIHRGFPVIAIVPSGPGGEAMRPVLRDLNRAGADVLLVGGSIASAGGAHLVLPDHGPEHLSPLLLILPLQLFVLHLGRQRGCDPDRPEGLQKVTSTW